MSQTAVDFTNLFIRAPGDLIYYLVVIALSQAGFFMALGLRLRYPMARAPRQYTLALLGVVIAWAALLLGALYSIVSGQPADSVLPPMERAVQVIAILLLSWVFLTADHDRWGRAPNTILLALLALVVIGWVITGLDWASIYARSDFNLSSYGVAWTFVAAVVAVFGLLLTVAYFRTVIDAPLKVVFFALLLIGHVGTLAQTAQGNIIGDYAGLIRLSFVGALLLVPTLIFRVILAQYELELARADAAQQTALATRAEPGEGGATVAERESVQLMRALGMMLEKVTLDTIPERIVTSSLTVLRADIGALVRVQSANYADIIWGQDKVLSRTIGGLSINLDDQPTLVNAIERRLQRPLYPDRNVEELHDLYTRLDVEPVGPTYFQPLVSERELLGVLVIGLPYSGRELSHQEAELLKGIGIIAANLLALSDAAAAAARSSTPAAFPDLPEGERGALIAQELDAARRQIADLSRQVTQLQLELDDERTRVATEIGDTEEGKTISQRIAALNEEHQQLVEDRDRLAIRLREAETALVGAVATDNETMFSSMIDTLRHERDELMAQRDRLQEQLSELRRGAPIPATVEDMLDAMREEKDHLEGERDRLQSKLTDIETQLDALGIQGGTAGLGQLVAQLFEQRSALQAKNEAFKRERDALLQERAQLEDAIQREAEREKRLETLQTEIQHLASDREAVTKQRDRLRADYDEQLARQEAVKEQYARLMAEMTGFEQELIEAHEERRLLREQVKQVADERSSLMKERDSLRARLQALEVERDQLVGRVEGDRERLGQLGVEGVGSLTRMVEDLSAQRSELERQLNEMHDALAAADDRFEVLQLRAKTQNTPPASRPDNPELILGMVQELRTPMTSIVGYVELLLNESAGILGEMQRKFLQRVSANVTRLTSMLEDLTRITSLDAGHITLTPERVDVIEVIEDAITAASNQLREKGLTVHLDLADDLPLARGDRDAVSQIVGQLLTNAYLASPPASEIFVTARQELRQPYGRSEAATGQVHISIEDRGGGIAPEDQSRVFARKYKAENPLIQGLGDTGVGLAIARALVEAQGGEIWLESKPGVGSTFHFTLPVELEAEAER